MPAGESLDEVIERTAMQAEFGNVVEVLQRKAAFMQPNTVSETSRRDLQAVLATAKLRESTRHLLEAIYLGTKAEQRREKVE